MSLKIVNFSKRYDDKWILRDFSIEVAEGEIFCLLGANGAGKSAVLRLISGQDKPNSGQIFLAGEDLTNAAEKARNITFLTDETNQNSWKNIFKSAKPSGVSDGERQNFDFKDALANSGKILLLDNPFGCLDPLERDKALESLRRTTKEKNLIVILATNDFEEAFLASDRVGVLNRGEIAQIGTPRELYENPNSVAVAKLLGRNNLVPARRVTFNNQLVTEFQTLTGDHRIRTDKTDKRMLGAITNNVSLMIRPEHISLSFGASFPEDNLLKAKIVGVQYLGATTRVNLDADGLILEALVLRLVGLNAGDECMVGLPPDRITVLKE